MSPARTCGPATSGVGSQTDGGGLRRDEIAEIQRVRLLAAAAAEVDAHGYAATTVARITTRARVSRRTFYELFENREECVLIVVQEAIGKVERELREVNFAALSWRERVRQGLLVILRFLDREPALARLCVVQSLGGGPQMLRRREEILARLTRMVDEGRGEGPRGAACSPLTAEGVVGAAFAILHARLARRDAAPLTALLGELTGIVVLPYIGAAASKREQSRPTPDAPADSQSDARRPAKGLGDPLCEMPMRLTYRTALVLEGIDKHPGSSNRQAGDYAGVSDPGQISKLLARLERLGLLANTGSGARVKGEPNAWMLTAKGEQIAHSIRLHAAVERSAA